MTKSVKITLGLISFFIIASLLLTLTEPFKTNFITQIVQSELPFPVLSYLSGKIGGAITGLIFLSLVFLHEEMKPRELDIMFYLGSSLLLIMLTVSTYVHLHPNVPAEILPFQTKPPFLSVFMLVLLSLAVFFKIKNPSEASQA